MKTLSLKLISGFLAIVMVAVTFVPASANPGSTIDFEGLAEGAFVNSVASGAGISGDPVEGSVAVFGYNPFFPGVNAAMIFDATCSGGCSGGASDLYGPAQGNVLIISRDLDQNDPEDLPNPRGYFEFGFSGLGWGWVTVESLVVGDIDSYQAGANIQLFGSGVLLATVAIPVTGDGVYATVPVGVSNVDRMRVYLKGSGAIDDLKFIGEPTPPSRREVLYLSDTALRTDGISHLYRVDIDQVGRRANLTLLPNGEVSYNHVDILSSTPDGSRLYFMDDGNPSLQKATLAYYDVPSASVHEIGVVTANGVNVFGFDQAAFSPDGTMYATSTFTDKLYRINLTTAVATEVGEVVDQATGVPLNIAGADIAFTVEGTAYLYTDQNVDTQGLYLISIPAGQGTVEATFLSQLSDLHVVVGMAVRASGYGDLVASTETDEIHVLAKSTGQNIVRPLPLYLDGVRFNTRNGDMSIGPFTLCTSPMAFWRDHSWEGIRIKVLNVVVDETLGKEIMTNADKKNFSLLFSEFIAARLNTNNSTGITVIDRTRNWMAGQGLINPDGTLNWSKSFSSSAQRAKANEFVSKLQAFNVSSPCR